MYWNIIIVLSIATSSSASPRSAVATNAGASCHCCANILNRWWETEAWRNVYALGPSSNAVVFPERGRALESG